MYVWIGHFVSTGLMQGSIRDVVFSQMVLDDYECMRGPACCTNHLNLYVETNIHQSKYLKSIQSSKVVILKPEFPLYRLIEVLQIFQLPSLPSSHHD